VNDEEELQMIDVTIRSGSKPPLGGWLPPAALSAPQADVLNAIADELIPGGEGFPPPSGVNVVGFIVRYVAPSGQEAKWYPFLTEAEFARRLDELGSAFVSASSAERVQVLIGLERDDAEFFGRLRDMVYYAYYSRPEVVAAINRNLEAGRDYRNSPQPYGYTDVMDDWDDDLLSRVKGTYTRTEDVVRLPLPENLRP
jgi:hypothetical protein